MDNQEIRTTPIWQLYEKGQNFHRQVRMYTDTDRNYRFYNDDQWAGAKLDDVEPVQKNFIKPIVRYKVGIIHDNLYAINYSSQNFSNRDFAKESGRYCDMLNRYIHRVWEAEKMDIKGRKVSKDAAINGEGIFYVDFDRKKMLPVHEIVKKVDIYYGNENDDDIQAQPYIIMRKRMSVAEAVELAEARGISGEELENIKGDNDTFEESGDDAKIEVNDGVTVLYKAYKKNGTVHFSIATKFVTIVEDVDIGISLYPFAHFNWEEKEGSARGEGEVRCLIPNQIEVNRTEMRRVLTVRSQAYPHKVVDTSKVANPSALNTVGGVIKTQGNTVDDVRKIVGTLPPAQMSSDVVKLQEDLINISRELAGAGDIATGQVNPEDASGRAILAVQQASQAPVTEQKENHKNMLEDVAKIDLEYLIAYSVNGIALEDVVTDEAGNEIVVVEKVPQSVLKALQATVKIDVTPKSPFDKFAREQTLENLLVGGWFAPDKIGQLEAYAKALPDDSVAPKQEILQIIADIKEEQRKIAIIEARAQLMEQNAQQFYMSDAYGQAQQIADAQRQLQAEQPVA